MHVCVQLFRTVFNVRVNQVANHMMRRTSLSFKRKMFLNIEEHITLSLNNIYFQGTSPYFGASQQK